MSDSTLKQQPPASSLDHGLLELGRLPGLPRQSERRRLVQDVVLDRRRMAEETVVWWNRPAPLEQSLTLQQPVAQAVVAGKRLVHVEHVGLRIEAEPLEQVGVQRQRELRLRSQGDRAQQARSSSPA